MVNESLSRWYVHMDSKDQQRATKISQNSFVDDFVNHLHEFTMDMDSSK